MSYDEVIDHVAQVVEAVGVFIIVVGGLLALVVGAVACATPDRRANAYSATRRRLGRAILLGLEVLIIGDIVRTIVVTPTVESVVVLGLIVLIRIVLSFALEVEMDGSWPWARWRRGAADDS